MKTTTWTLYVFVGFVALCHLGFSSPIVKRQVLDNPANIDPVQQHTYKQLLHKPFHLLHKRAIGVTPTPKMPTTTEDLVVFNPGEKVSLEVPGELFGSGFTLVTNISQIIGSVIQNSAERTAKLFEAMKPFLQTVFGVNSLHVTRDEPANNKI